MEFVRHITVDRYFLPIASRMYMWDHTVVQTKSCFLYSPSHYLPVVFLLL